MKIIRMLFTSLFYYISWFFFSLRAKALCFVDEEYAVEVVQFVLDADGQEVVRLQQHALAVAVGEFAFYIAGALHLALVVGHGKAALGAHYTALFFDDDGVDELEEAFAHVDDYDALGDADLGGGEADAVGGIHGFGHVLEETVQLFIYTGYGLGYLAQNGVAGH